MNNPFRRIVNWFRERRELRLNLYVLQLRNEALQDAVVSEFQDKQKQLLTFHHVIAAVVIQNGGEIVLNQDLVAAGGDNLVDFLSDDNGESLTVRLRPKPEEEQEVNA